MDLDAHISLLLSSGASCVAAAQRSASNYKAATRAFPRVIPTANQWDYKNIIEKLQVAGATGVGEGGCLRSTPSCAAHALLGLLIAGRTPGPPVALVLTPDQDTAQSWQHLSIQAVHPCPGSH